MAQRIYVIERSLQTHMPSLSQAKHHFIFRRGAVIANGLFLLACRLNHRVADTMTNVLFSVSDVMQSIPANGNAIFHGDGRSEFPNQIEGSALRGIPEMTRTKRSQHGRSMPMQAVHDAKFSCRKVTRQWSTSLQHTVGCSAAKCNDLGPGRNLWQVLEHSGPEAVSYFSDGFNQIPR